MTTLHPVITSARVAVMTNTLAEAVSRLVEVAHTLTELGIPGDAVHAMSVNRWSTGTVVSVQINGDTARHVEMVDRIADSYGLPADDGETSNYHRGALLGKAPVNVYCGRPIKVDA